ncbi:MAG: hypothetical protein LWY06_17875 [Firmicutes bacterium]|nr:hypothetical protein [Bacillota bacterium]
MFKPEKPMPDNVSPMDGENAQNVAGTETQPGKTGQKPPPNTAITWGCLLLLIFCALFFTEYILISNGVLSSADEGGAIKKTAVEFNTEAVYPGGWGVIDLRECDPLGNDQIHWYYEKLKMALKNPDTGSVLEYKKAMAAKDFDFDDTKGVSSPVDTGKVYTRSDPSATEFYVFGGGTIPKTIDFSIKLDSAERERIKTAMVKFRVPEDYPPGKLEAELNFTVRKITNVIPPQGSSPGSFNVGSYPLNRTFAFTILKDKEAYDKAKADRLKQANAPGVNINRTINGIMLLLLVSTFCLMLYSFKKGFEKPFEEDKQKMG